ncbi:hypothetical protein [Verrucosispora sp. TAA-831]|uniref:hypothetical protein n=1 Tax=Verrucosispora sp. TAA-831 TaxID=3422227 RepID=UPI003D6E3198
MWSEVETNRWTWTADTDMHLLLRADGTMWELHVSDVAYLHRYAPAGEPGEQPLDGATWRDTRELPDLPATESAGWEALTEAATGGIG